MSQALPVQPEPAPETRVDLKSLTREQLTAWVREVLGEPRFRGDQIFRWLHAKRARDLAGMTDLSKALRARLDGVARIGGLALEDVKVAQDGTQKLLFVTAAGDRLESVLIPMEDRVTQCVSSQIGCKIGCQFCLTARMPMRRNLSAAEIVDQVLWAQEVLGEERRVSNIVYMGMGEPLDNYDNVVASLRILMDELGAGFSSRRITVSTSGVVPKIARLGQDVQVNLAVSLNASYDAQRTSIIPINKAWDIGQLMAALRAFPLPPRRRITIEYVLLAGVNDTVDDARRLVRLLSGIYCKVNLIPFNPWPGAPYARPDNDTVEAFGAVLRDAEYTVTIRYSKGEDIGAACGQLDGVS
ncbi:MAG: 23S rRNA (adenine(2503)-C(2))-methyltransferase RlmN [Deltaproteobacteria bacterium HGW-Deltaproteobacteria-14]|jgi:23S rRNA (adenine2503-C2)-methyltransferase|nr:MAG: 23S rRNA (adenine(2503)-C(2))-methyltransferase RlmN [Deltaproteobacteria bacterium HGW-Deltaproteobacteria-14]